MSIGRVVITMILMITLLHAAAMGAVDQTKTASVLYSESMRTKAITNAAKFPWAAKTRDDIVKAAEPFLKFSDDELWSSMFGNTLTRSWMVWSNGFCPACKKGVPMYNWEMDALNRPWKTRCPNCKEIFPKNDFKKFYDSGLDEHGIFDPAKGDRSLLFNTEHPDPNDPLHMFGVDDGTSYFDGTNHWWFIGAYLIYGQWKQLVVGEVEKLAAAYIVTGDKKYAHKAGVLLDRVADLYPTFDFKREGLVYEGPGRSGYVSTWHDACFETRSLALSYDQIFDGIKDDQELVKFLAAKAKTYKLDNAKSSFADVQRNIEDRIFRDALADRPKTQSNFPQTDITFTIIKTALGWPANREELLRYMGEWLATSTAVDGITGEKGLCGYAGSSPQIVGIVLEMYARMDPNFLKDALARYPALHASYRFHIDTWCLGTYYPTSGDGGAFASRYGSYYGLTMNKEPGITPSTFSFLWRLYEQTKDPAFAQVLVKQNGGNVDGLPHDLFADDPAAFQQSVSAVIKQVGHELKIGSVNKEQWHIAVMRAGEGKNERAMWLDYDSGGGHSHADGMNLGLFAKGLDFLPDFGYPPVQYGGWESPKAKWYTMTAAHNTVVVDGANQLRAGVGKTTLWADGKTIQAIRVSAKDMYPNMEQYERTAAMVDVSETDFYILDVFRVVGGKDHAKFLYSHFGDVTPNGLDLKDAPDYGNDTQTRSFKCDLAPKPGWSVDWKVNDRYKLLAPGADVHLRYTDLTYDATAMIGQAWINPALFNSNDDVWIPCVVTRRQTNDKALSSTFVGVIEPYENKSTIANITRLPVMCGDVHRTLDSQVAVEVHLVNGCKDIHINPNYDVSSDGYTYPVRVIDSARDNIDLDGEMCFIRQSKSGEVERIALTGITLTVQDITLKLKPKAGFVEIEFQHGKPVLVSGKASDIEDVLIGKKSIWRQQ